MPQGMQNYDEGDEDQEEIEGEEEEEEEEEEDIDDDPQLIIINQDPFMDDDKKIVYLSNINSCSLPQTPKLDPSGSNSQLNNIRPKPLAAPIQSTFDYIARKNGHILEHLQPDCEERIQSPIIEEDGINH